LQVEDLTAGIEHAAVNSTCIKSGNFAGGNGNHCLIEQCHAASDFSLPNQSTALSL
jgi:hypothetical protein